MYNHRHRFGELHAGETGIFTRRNPDTVRGMDVALISAERAKEANRDGFLTVAPELIVEILSPGNSWYEVQQKLNEYFGIGTKMIWIVIPESSQIYVYRSLTDLKIFTMHDTLTCEDVLPEFSVSVEDIFG